MRRVASPPSLACSCILLARLFLAEIEDYSQSICNSFFNLFVCFFFSARTISLWRLIEDQVNECALNLFSETKEPGGHRIEV